MYVKNSCRIRDRIEVEKHYSGRFGAPGCKREPKRKKTPEEMERQNYWRKCRDLRRTIELNFGEGDWHVTLTCRKKDRPTLEEARKIIRAFRDKLRKEYKRQGWELKYIITCEIGERGAVHWHMIVNDCHSDDESTAGSIRKIWNLGRVHFTPLDDTGDYSQLAEYIVKESAKRMEAGETIEKLSYIPSRNLIRPKVEREKVDAKKWNREPRVPKGWELVKGTLVNGVNKFTGLPYQHYIIRRKERRIDEDSGRVRRDKPSRKRKGHRTDNVHPPDDTGEW